MRARYRSVISLVIKVKVGRRDRIVVPMSCRGREFKKELPSSLRIRPAINNLPPNYLSLASRLHLPIHPLHR
jgi:hypothetical protein